MRTMMKVMFPVGPANKGLSDGSFPKAIESFIEQTKPEATYFTAQNGQRTAIFVFDLKDAAQIPTICEDFFQSYDAEIELAPVMNLEDLRAGITKWQKSNGKEKGRAPQAQAR
jgi:hypothetical protein